MKEIIPEMQYSEKKGGVLLKVLPAALALVLLGTPAEGHEQTVSDTYEGAKVTEVTLPGTQIEERKDTITLDEAMKLVKDDGISEVKNDVEKGKINTFGFVKLGTCTAPDFYDILSSNPGLLSCIGANYSKKYDDIEVSIGANVIRLTDFDKIGVSILNPNFSVSGGNRSTGVGLECTKLDDKSGITNTPFIYGSYNNDRFNVEGKIFKQGKMISLRTALRYQISDALNASGIGWVKLDENGQPVCYTRLELEGHSGGNSVNIGVNVRPGGGRVKLEPTVQIAHNF